MKRIVFHALLTAFAMFSGASASFALPVGSATVNGNYIMFPLDPGDGNMGEVMVYQTRTELMVKFKTMADYGKGPTKEHTMKYKLRRDGTLPSGDMFMVTKCTDLFKQAASTGGTFFVMVDNAGSTSCALNSSH